MFLFCGHPVHVVYRILRLPCICGTPPVLSASLHVIDKIKQSECVRILHSQVTDDISHLDILGCIVRSYIPLQRSWFWNEPTIYLITSSQNIECSQPTIETLFSLNFRLTMICFICREVMSTNLCWTRTDCPALVQRTLVTTVGMAASTGAAQGLRSPALLTHMFLIQARVMMLRKMTIISSKFHF